MSRDATYKAADAIIVTVPVTPELHRRLRLAAADDRISIKALVTRLLNDELPEYPR